MSIEYSVLGVKKLQLYKQWLADGVINLDQLVKLMYQCGYLDGYKAAVRDMEID